MDRFSFLNTISPAFIGDMYEKYLQHPDSIEPSWKSFFQGYDFANETYLDSPILEEVTTNNGSMVAIKVSDTIPEEVQKEFKVINLINGYRSRGHLFTKTNPVRERRTYEPTLDIETFGLDQSDLKKTFKAGEILGMDEESTLENIVKHLQQIYCDSIGLEYMYIRKPEVVQWIQKWINANINHPTLSEEEKRQTLRKLNQAVAFENFLHTKFVGQKRFSLEGNESLIPALDALINRSADLGVREFVVGMAHRGRLNVLANIFNKSYYQIFSEFEGKDFEESIFSGDVKYHMGSTTETKTADGKKIKMNLAPNPSHLETVDPVVEGISRAKIDLDYHHESSKLLPILIHGDGAIAAQGVVFEVIQMETLDGYKTGGTVHIVVNNQIAFTTNYLDSRSSTYCTDVAKVTLSPVLHVNSDDVEAVIHAMRFAADYRAEFKKDVFIDLLGYRKYGHNEGDEPRFTQPALYDIISKHPNPREIYKSKLMSEGIVGEKIVREMEEEYKELLNKDFDVAKGIEKNKLDPFMPDEWEKFSLVSHDECFTAVDTTYPLDKLKDIALKVTEVPPHKKFVKKAIKLMEQRRAMVFETDKIDWGMAELLAYGTLLEQEYNVRLSGEDVQRGTFSHRHAVMKTEDEKEEYISLNHLSKNQGKFEAYNSLLSEYGVLGFDYGYAMAAPETLVIWEAQFGDFANVAQVIIDQYISAAEDKWKIMNGLTMYLPHGYEGQGAEHSSARLERFLQLCADWNMTVIMPTTPANFYHAIRKQMLAYWRKPLIVFTPKSLLRHPKVISSIEQLADGSFHTIYDDTTADPKKVTKVVMCSGKIYYELMEKKEELKADNTAIIRLEQLYPLDFNQIEHLLDVKYKHKKQIIWAQEEPENMGAWGFILRKLRKYPFELCSPKSSGAPAPGSHQKFHREHKEVIDKVFS